MYIGSINIIFLLGIRGKTNFPLVRFKSTLEKLEIYIIYIVKIKYYSLIKASLENAWTDLVFFLNIRYSLSNVSWEKLWKFGKTENVLF